METEAINHTKEIKLVLDILPKIEVAAPDPEAHEVKEEAEAEVEEVRPLTGEISLHLQSLFLQSPLRKLALEDHLEAASVLA